MRRMCIKDVMSCCSSRYSNTFLASVVKISQKYFRDFGDIWLYDIRLLKMRNCFNVPRRNSFGSVVLPTSIDGVTVLSNTVCSNCCHLKLVSRER